MGQRRLPLRGPYRPHPLRIYLPRIPRATPPPRQIMASITLERAIMECTSRLTLRQIYAPAGIVLLLKGHTNRREDDPNVERYTTPVELTNNAGKRSLTPYGFCHSE